MDPGELPDGVAVAAKRHDVLAALQGDPLYKARLVERMDHSRSTVDRAVRELDDAGLVERVGEGFVATQSGRLLARRYREFVAAGEAIVAAQPVVDALPRGVDVPGDLVTDAAVDATGDRDALVDRLRELTAATELRVALPRLADSRHVRTWFGPVVAGDLAVELVAPRAVLDRLSEEFPRLASELAAADGFEARAGDVPGYGLVVADGPNDDVVPAVLLVAFEDGDVAGFLDATGEDALAWGDDRYADVRAGSSDASDDLAATDGGAVGGLATARELGVTLRSEGFVRVEDALTGGRPAARRRRGASGWTSRRSPRATRWGDASTRTPTTTARATRPATGPSQTRCSTAWRTRTSRSSDRRARARARSASASPAGGTTATAAPSSTARAASVGRSGRRRP
jgi:DNA-binding transcriptional ArsR family regulator